jgi:hypothetical protein
MKAVTRWIDGHGWQRLPPLKSCRHPKRDRVTMQHADWNVLYDCNICKRCGEWLSMGDSNDASEAVRIEMRAAETADVLVNTDALIDWTLSNEDFVSFIAFEERRGWSIAESSMQHHSNAWHAGYLARTIHDHDEDA